MAEIINFISKFIVIVLYCLVSLNIMILAQTRKIFVLYNNIHSLQLPYFTVIKYTRKIYFKFRGYYLNSLIHNLNNYYG